MPIRISCHQPNFLPPLNFFSKMQQSDILVLLDEVQFSTHSSKNHYLNRCKFYDNKWYTIPVFNKNKQLIKDVRISNNSINNKLHDKVKQLYKNAPFFNKIPREDIYLAFFNEYINKANYHLILLIRDILELDTEIILQSDLQLGEFTNPDERLVNIIHNLNGNIYVSGPKGREYMNKDIYKKHNIDVLINEYKLIEYPSDHEFIPYLSIIDPIAYNGYNLNKYLESTLITWI